MIVAELFAEWHFYQMTPGECIAVSVLLELQSTVAIIIIYIALATHASALCFYFQQATKVIGTMLRLSMYPFSASYH